MVRERAELGWSSRGSDTQRASARPAVGKQTLAGMLPMASAPVQRKGAPGSADVHASAQRGVATAASPLPHAGTIQRLFGRHDISGIQAHTGPDAGASARDMGAEAYATGDHVVLGGAADLHTVAHEAAHVVQQRAGVHLKGGVGAAGDAYERHADAVADRVVRGHSAEALLDEHAGAPGQARAGISTSTVQHKLFIGPRLKPQRIAPEAVMEQVLDTVGGNALSAGNLTTMATDPDRSYWFETWDDAVARTEVASDPFALVTDLDDSAPVHGVHGASAQAAAGAGQGVTDVGAALEGRELLRRLGDLPAAGGGAQAIVGKATAAVGASVQPQRTMPSVRVGVTSRDEGGPQEYLDRLLASYGTRAEVVVILRFEDVYSVDGLFIPGGMFDLPDTVGVDGSHAPKHEKQQTQWATRAALQRRLIAFARHNNLPILGVCGGSRALAQGVDGGSTQYLGAQDRQQHNHHFGAPWEAAHGVSVERDSMLGRVVGGEHYRTGTTAEQDGATAPTMNMPVNSMHWASSHFTAASAVDVSASTASRQPQGQGQGAAPIVEGWSLQNHPLFMGTQWHPEFAQLGLDDFAGQDEPHRRIMSALGDAAEEHRAVTVLQRVIRAHLAQTGRGDLDDQSATTTSPVPRIRIDNLRPGTGPEDLDTLHGLQPRDIRSGMFPPDGEGRSAVVTPSSAAAAQRILALNGQIGLTVYQIPQR